MALIKVKFTLGNGANDGYVKIDRKGVDLTNGRGEAEVDAAAPHHPVTMWFVRSSVCWIFLRISRGIMPGEMMKGE